MNTEHKPAESKEPSKAAEDLMQRFERSTDRYIDNEKFIQSYSGLPFWKRLFFGQSIMLRHLQSMLKKYPD